MGTGMKESYKLPSMPFFVSDYLSATDVLLMSLAERGLYVHLLFRQWQDGPLEFNPKKLSVLCACSESEFLGLWNGISGKFHTDSDGRIYNKRAESVKKEYVKLRRKRSEAGSKGGSKHQANLKQNAKQTSSKNQPPVQSSPIHSYPIQSSPVQDTASTKPKREKEKPASATGISVARSIFNYWNRHNDLTRHGALSQQAAASINARLQAGYSEADLCRAITRYADLCQQGTAPGHNNWSLSLLMSREEGGWIDRMLDPKYEGIISETRDSRRRKQNAAVLGIDSEIPRLGSGDASQGSDSADGEDV